MEERSKEDRRCLRKSAIEGDKERLLGVFEKPIKASGHCGMILLLFGSLE